MSKYDEETTTELIILWVLTGVSVAIMMARLIMKWKRRPRFELGDYLTIAAIIAVLVRGSVEHVAMVWKGNQIPASFRAKHHFTPQDIHQREIAAKLTMVNRVFYTVYIWLQKCVVMCVVQQLLMGLEFYSILNICWATLGVTFVASVTACFIECKPFRLYWQVVPDPGKCASGKLQLLVFSILEMLTDVILMALPLRHLVKIRRPWLSRLRLLLLFTVGTTIIAVTLTRLLLNQLHYHRSGASHNIANVEILFAAFVANSPPIYGFINSRYGSSSERSTSKSNNISRSNEAGRQLDTLNSVSSAPRRPRANLGNWSQTSGTRKNGDVDSDEELIIVSPPSSATIS